MDEGKRQLSNTGSSFQSSSHSHSHSIMNPFSRRPWSAASPSRPVKPIVAWGAPEASAGQNSPVMQQVDRVLEKELGRSPHPEVSVPEMAREEAVRFRASSARPRSVQRRRSSIRPVTAMPTIKLQRRLSVVGNVISPPAVQHAAAEEQMPGVRARRGSLLHQTTQDINTAVSLVMFNPILPFLSSHYFFLAQTAVGEAVGATAFTAGLVERWNRLLANISIE